MILGDFHGQTDRNSGQPVKAPFAAREQHLQQSNAQAAQQQVDSDLAEERILDQSRPVPMDETSASQLATGDRAHSGALRSVNAENRRKPPQPEMKSAPPAGVQIESERIDFLA